MHLGMRCDCMRAHRRTPVRPAMERHSADRLCNAETRRRTSDANAAPGVEREQWIRESLQYTIFMYKCLLVLSTLSSMLLHFEWPKFDLPDGNPVRVLTSHPGRLEIEYQKANNWFVYSCWAIWAILFTHIYIWPVHQTGQQFILFLRRFIRDLTLFTYLRYILIKQRIDVIYLWTSI